MIYRNGAVGRFTETRYNIHLPITEKEKKGRNSYNTRLVRSILERFKYEYSAQEMTSETEGLTVIDAINAKYSGEALSGFCQIHISANAPGKTDSGNIRVPHILALDNNSISCAGNQDDITSVCGHVTELDLTNNKLVDWNQVFWIVKAMKCLQALNLTANKLNDCTLENTTFSPNPSLKLLVLNKTAISWNSIHHLLHVFPCVSELHLSLNEYHSVLLNSSVPYHSLTKLHLNKHNITHWHAFCEIGGLFPNLQTLMMIDSALSCLECECDATKQFPNLQCLHISKTNVQGWTDIECLRKFPKLCEVRIKDIPFLKNWEEKLRRQLIISYLPNIMCLNGSSVKEQEREDAERSFIRYFMDQQQKPNRYFELEEKHGKLDPLVEVDLAPKVMYKIKVTMAEKEDDMEINVTQTLREFKKFLQTFAGLPSAKFHVFHHSYNGYYDMNEMKVLDKFLYSYHIEDGSMVEIEPRK